jgi:hypothetical protein
MFPPYPFELFFVPALSCSMFLCYRLIPLDCWYVPALSVPTLLCTHLVLLHFPLSPPYPFGFVMFPPYLFKLYFVPTLSCCIFLCSRLICLSLFGKVGKRAHMEPEGVMKKTKTQIVSRLGVNTEHGTTFPRKFEGMIMKHDMAPHS